MALILLIDDDAMVRGAIRRALESAGHEVAEAAHGGPALERLAEGGVDLILTDLLMPDVEGLEVLATARRLFPDVPVLVMSGGFPPERAGASGVGADYLRMARQLGATRTLAKPFRRAQLLAAVATCLANAPARGR